MRWLWWLLLLCAAACTSTWERHQNRLAEHEANGRHEHAAAEARWLAENAFFEAPEYERTESAEARRYLRLAALAAKTDDVSGAVEALRRALTADPAQAPAVRAQLQRLPLGAAEREHLEQEFAWNIAVLAPADDALLQANERRAQCWSYRVREVRVHRPRTVRRAGSVERQVSYDARPWAFDARSGRWYPDGAWVTDAGGEIESAEGPSQPRYRALIEAEHQFFTGGVVPPCHRAGWRGPYDPSGTVFVAVELPLSP